MISLNTNLTYKNDKLDYLLSLNNNNINQLILDSGTLYATNILNNNPIIKDNNIDINFLNNQDIIKYQEKIIELQTKLDLLNNNYTHLISNTIDNNVSNICNEKNNIIINTIKDNNNNSSILSIEKKINNIDSTFSNYFEKFIKGNIEKGNFGEKFIENFLYDKFSNCSIVDTHKETSFGDLIFSYNELKTLVESKNVQTCKKEDFNKFFRDVELRATNNEINSALYISLNDTGLLNNTKYFNFQFRNNIPIILISNAFNNPEFIRFSIILLDNINLFLKNQKTHFDINNFINNLNNILNIVMNQFEYIDSDKKLISKLQININNREKDLNIIHQQITNLIKNNASKQINTIQNIEDDIIKIILNEMNKNKNFKLTLKSLLDLNISAYDIKKLGGIKNITTKIKENKKIII